MLNPSPIACMILLLSASPPFGPGSETPVRVGKGQIQKCSFKKQAGSILLQSLLSFTRTNEFVPGHPRNASFLTVYTCTSVNHCFCQKYI